MRAGEAMACDGELTVTGDTMVSAPAAGDEHLVENQRLQSRARCSEGVRGFVETIPGKQAAGRNVNDYDARVRRGLGCRVNGMLPSGRGGIRAGRGECGERRERAERS